MVWTLRSHAERLSKQTKRVDGLARTTKAKATPARARARAKARARTKERVNYTGKEGRKDFHEMEGHENKQETQNRVKNTPSGRTRIGITLTTGLMQTGGRATGAQIS